MIQRLLDWFRNLSWVQAVVAFAKRLRPWGFEGLSLHYVSVFFVEGLQKGGISTRAAAISFRLFLAVFPVIILLISLIPYVPVDNFQENLFAGLEGLMPGDSFGLFEATLEDLMYHKYNSVVSFGFVLLIFYASNSVNAILMGLNGSYNLVQKGNPVFIRLASIALLFLLGLFLVVAVALIALSGWFFDWLIAREYLTNEVTVILLQLAKWVIAVALVYFSISIIYNTGNFRKKRWKWFSAGASFSTLFFILASLLFAWFVNNFASYNRLYGSLGTLMVLLIWVNFNSLILLLGFELNTSIHRARRDAERQNLIPPR